MSKKKLQNSDWRDLIRGAGALKQRSAPVPWRARLRKLWLWIRRLFLLCAIAGLAFGAWYAYRNLYIEEIFSSEAHPIKKIEFKTDGVISPKWLTSYLKLPKKSTFNDVNIFALKNSLESLTQVKSASVERIYPDTLRIVMTEHKPMVKFFAKVDYTDRIYLMSPEGIFFEPICVNAGFVEKLPSLAGASLKFDGSVPQKYEHAAALEEFLAYAQAKGELANWKEVNVSSLANLTMPLLSVKTRNGTQIIFSTKDYIKQFDRLEYILRYSKEKGLNAIERIDLSLKGRADVKYSDYPKK